MDSKFLPALFSVILWNICYCPIITLPACFKPKFVCFFHLFHCWQGTIESSAEYNCIFSHETVATIFLNMENPSISATYIKFWKWKKKET